MRDRPLRIVQPDRPHDLIDYPPFDDDSPEPLNMRIKYWLLWSALLGVPYCVGVIVVARWAFLVARRLLGW